MIPAFVKELGSANNKTAGTTLAHTFTGATAAGNLIVARVLFDNFTTASKPIVSSIGKMAGETANWLFLGAARSTSTSAGAFASGELWCIQTTVAWSAAAYTVTLDSSVTQKAIMFTEFSGAQAVLRGTVGTAYSTTTTAANAAPGSTGLANDLVLGFLFGSNVAAAQAGASAALAWSTPVGVGSTGGSGATNNFGVGQYKVLTSTTSVAYANSAAMTAGNGAIVAILQPIPEPAITQAAYQLFDDAGTESGAAALAAQNTAVTGNLSNGDGYGMIRVRLQSTTAQAVPTTDDFQLQCEKNASGVWTNVSSGIPALVDTYSTRNGAWAIGNGSHWGVGQTFRGTGQRLSRVGFQLSRLGAPTGDLQAHLWTHSGTYGTSGVPTGASLATSTTTLSVTSVTAGSWAWYYFDFDGTTTLAAGTNYVITVDSTVLGINSSNQTYVGADASILTHSGNSVYNTTAWFSSTWDTTFELYTFTETVPYDNPNLTESQATTNRLTGGTGTFTAGKVSEIGHVTNVGWSGNNYTEILYSVKLIAAELANGDTLRFRVVRNAATTTMTYTVTPTVNITANLALVVADAAHSQTSGEATLEAEFTLAVADAAQVQTAEPSQPAVNLTVADAAQAQTADNVILALGIDLVPADAAQAQSAEAPTLGLLVDLVVADAPQLHAAEEPTLALIADLVVASAAHISVSDNVVLTIAGEEIDGVIQEGFRWRNDDGSETTATWKAAQDTNASLALATPARLRVLLDTTEEYGPIAYKLYYKKTTDSVWEPVPVGAGSPGYLDEVLTDSPAAVWMLDETAGTTANDSSTNNRDGTYTSTYTLNAATVFGLPAVDLSGGGRVEVPDSTAFSGHAGASGLFTAECLINLDSLSTGEIVTKAGGGGVYEYRLYITGTTPGFTLWNSAGSDVVAFTSLNALLATGTNYHIAVTIDRAGTACKLYVNGVDQPLSPTTPTFSGNSSDTTTIVSLGRRADGSNAMDGRLAGVAIYPTVLSAARVAAHYAALGGSGTSGPVYITPSANITAGGQATTALLTPPVGKTTAAFSVGRMWDDENGTDTVDI